MSISGTLPTSFATIKPISKTINETESENILPDRREVRNVELAKVLEELKILKKESGKVLEELLKREQ